jgi:hypothetical protein
MRTPLTPAQRQLRQNVRNFLLIATIPELEQELEISEGDRKTFVQELLTEAISEATEAGYDKLAEGWVG